MRKVFRFLLALTAFGVLAFATFNLAAYLLESRESTDLNENVIGEAVTVKKPVPKPAVKDIIAEQESVPNTECPPVETAPIEVDFDALWETNEDVVGWLYSEDTPINLPLLQAKDNDHYLYRMIDGSQNSAGSLFVDYRNAGDFSDRNTIIYGHNMKNKEMFGTISNYKEQAYFEEHPVMWLLTPEVIYQVELIAGYVTTANSRIYSFGQSEEDFFALLEQALQRSTFTSDHQISHEDRFVTLSTCSYEYDNARYVLIGRLHTLEQK